MTLTTIEKAAKLMGIESYKVINGHLYPVKDMRSPFNPRTNKADLMDLECELGIDINWDESNVYATSPEIEFIYSEDINNHPTKFAARVEAVIAVAVQIYDAKYGKDGE